MKLYAVGGAVRDHLRGVQGKDLDFAVEADSFDEMTTELRARGMETWLSRPEFVTVRGRIPLSSLGAFGGLLPPQNPPLKMPHFVAADFTLCRKEAQYSDKRHPDTVTPADILTDLSRRDFTMNAIAIDEDGILVDPYRGRQDIQDRVIRTVGDPHTRFEEDPLRMLRAIRFAVVSYMWIDGSVGIMMHDPDIVGLLASLPVERVVSELQIALKYNWYVTMQHLLVDFPLIGHFLWTQWPVLWVKATTEDR